MKEEFYCREKIIFYTLLIILFFPFVIFANENGPIEKILSRLIDVTGDGEAEKIILKAGGEASFKTVNDYRFTSCINLNEGVVHGIPGNRKIQEGDLVTVDLGTLYKGWHTDSGWTKEVKSEKLPVLDRPLSAEPKRGRRVETRSGKVKSCEFLKTGEKALWKAVDQCRVGNYLGDVSNTIQETIEGAGYSVVRNYVGHGIGRNLHEPPEIPGLGERGAGPELKRGMTLAIEVIYAEGSGETRVLEDGWTVITADQSNAALFEHTVAITKSGPIVLTE